MVSVDRRNALRLVLSLMVVAGLAGMALGYISYEGADVQGAAEGTDGVDRSPVSDLGGPTVVTTAPRQSATGEIIAFASDGSVIYYDDTYDWYYDVDPVNGSNRTVEFVASDLLPREECPEELDGCHVVVIERVNLSTGERERIHTEFDAGAWSGWHDVDRINGTHVLVAGIGEDRVFIMNTSSEMITWQWDASHYFEPTSGGVYGGDWTHINDVEVLPDGRVMVSARNQDRVLFVNRTTGVQSRWTLGAEDEYRVLYEQHNPDYIPASRGGPAVLVADSENNRVVEYHRADDGSWERVWGWTDPSMQWPRDADRLPNGRTLVVDSDGNRVLALAPSGDVAWQFNIDTPYDVERLGQAAESSGGPSATRAGLTGKHVQVRSDAPRSDPGDPPIAVEAKLFLRELLPGIVLSGITYVFPPWVGFRELAIGVALLGVGTAWVGIELHWRGYRLRLPVQGPPERDERTEASDSTD